MTFLKRPREQQDSIIDSNSSAPNPQLQRDKYARDVARVKRERTNKWSKSDRLTPPSCYANDLATVDDEHDPSL